MGRRHLSRPSAVDVRTTGSAGNIAKNRQLAGFAMSSHSGATWQPYILHFAYIPAIDQRINLLAEMEPATEFN